MIVMVVMLIRQAPEVMLIYELDMQAFVVTHALPQVFVHKGRCRVCICSANVAPVSASNFCKSWWALSVLCLLDLAWKNRICKHICTTMCLCDIAVTMDVTILRLE